jgi:hypothetical protein
MKMDRLDELLGPAQLAAEDEDFSEHQIRTGMANGRIPVIRLGAKGKIYKCTRRLWWSWRRGDPIPESYFQQIEPTVRHRARVAEA